MRRRGHLFEQIATFDNLLVAAAKALRGKKDRLPVADFYFHLETELLRLEEELQTDAYTPRPYRTFMVYEPKPRRICAAHIRDRVVHHAICNVLEPLFEAFFISDSFACRQDKGTHRAIRKAQDCSRRNRFFLKFDVRRFFESVDHQRLKELLERRIKDRRLLAFLGGIIHHPIPDAKPGKGLPIGNLTSQHFANFYLGHLDHFAKDQLGIRHYLRYMDDVLVFGDDKAALHQHCAQIRTFLKDRLSLELKEERLLLAPIFQGVPFLGVRVYPGMIRLRRAGWTRFKRKVREREQAYRTGQLDERGLVQSVQSLLGHLQHASTGRLRRVFFQQALLEG
jgi:retron-type reverse transcriptase